MRHLILASTAILALAGCDRLPFLGGGDVEANGSVAAGNGANASNAAADAGITSSRSFAGLGNDTQGQGGKDPAAVQTASAGGAVDPRLVGRWTDNGDCKVVTEFRPDGTFVASNGNVGNWAVEGNDLIFSRNGESMRLRLDSIEANRIVTTTPQGQSGPSTRC
jgi:hypothetical protein